MHEINVIQTLKWTKILLQGNEQNQKLRAKQS